MPSRFRLETLQKARRYWSRQPVFLDTETTGLNNISEILEISIIDHEGRLLLDTLVRPVRRPVPLDSVQVHGIRDHMLDDAPTWLQIWPKVEAILADRPVGIYNAEFDLRMMKQSHQAIGMPWRQPPWDVFCIMRMYSDFYGGIKWQRLEDAGRQCRLALPNTHRAKDDTLLAKAVFECMVNAAG